MGDDEVFGYIADERRGLAHLLSELTDEQLATPSLCAGWTVKDVAAHLVLGPTTSLPRFAGAMLRARGDFDKAMQALTALAGRIG